MIQNRIKIPFLIKWLRPLTFYKKVGLFQKIFASYFNRQEKGWVKTWTGMDWLIDPKADCHRWMIFGLYADPGFWKWLHKSLPENAVIVDSGANIGQYIPYYVYFLSGCKILAVEPIKELVQWISFCKQHNDLSNVSIVNCGLAAAEGEAMIQHAENPLLHGLWSHIDEKGTERVVLRKLDDILIEMGVEKVDLWKLDVEGYELEAIKGAEKHLRDRSIKAAYIELVPTKGHAANIINLMAEYGYYPFKYYDNGIHPLKITPREKADAIFLPSD